MFFYISLRKFPTSLQQIFINIILDVYLTCLWKYYCNGEDALLVLYAIIYIYYYYYIIGSTLFYTYNIK